jgi:hypothetical protein
MNAPAGTSAIAVPTRLGPLRVEMADSGPPAVLWHSLFVDSTTWARVREPLASVRRLLLVDGPGHGHNPPVARPFTLDDCAVDAECRAEAHGIASVAEIPRANSPARPVRPEGAPSVAFPDLREMAPRRLVQASRPRVSSPA